MTLAMISDMFSKVSVVIPLAALKKKSNPMERTQKLRDDGDVSRNVRFIFFKVLRAGLDRNRVDNVFCANHSLLDVVCRDQIIWQSVLGTLKIFRVNMGSVDGINIRLCATEEANRVSVLCDLVSEGSSKGSRAKNNDYAE